MSKKYLGAVMIWLGVFLGLSGVFYVYPPEYHHGNSKFLFKSKSFPDSFDTFGTVESLHAQAAFFTAVSGALIIAGIGFIKSKR